MKSSFIGMVLAAAVLAGEYVQAADTNAEHCVAAPNRTWFVNWDEAVAAARKRNCPIFVIANCSDANEACARVHKKVGLIHGNNGIVLAYFNTPMATPPSESQKQHNATVREKLGLGGDALRSKLVTADGKILCDLGDYDYEDDAAEISNALLSELAALPHLAKKHPDWKTAHANGVAWMYSEDQDGATIQVAIPLTKVAALKIPNQLGGKRVVRIRSAATSDGMPFCYCRTVSTIRIPAYLESIGANAFLCCPMLSSFTVDSQNRNFTSVGGVLFSKDKKTLCAYPCARPGVSYAVPSGVTSIGSRAFYRNTTLSSVTLPTSTTVFGHNAFAWCKNLSTINLPKGATGNDMDFVIGTLFSGCRSLKAVDADWRHPTYASVDGVLLNKDKTHIILFPHGKTGTYRVPDSVTTVNMRLFYDISFGNAKPLLTKLIVPSHVEIDYGPLRKLIANAPAPSGMKCNYVPLIVVDENGNERKE